MVDILVSVGSSGRVYNEDEREHRVDFNDWY